MGIEALASTLTSKLGFTWLRGQGTKERLVRNQNLSGLANGLRTSISAAQTVGVLDEAASTSSSKLVRSAHARTSNGLKRTISAVAKNNSDEAIKTASSIYKNLRCLGVAGNVVYAGAKALERDNIFEGGAIAFSGLGCMYGAEKAYDLGILKAAKYLNKIKFGGKLRILNPIIKGIGFIAASCAGMFAGEKVAENIFESKSGSNEAKVEKNSKAEYIKPEVMLAEKDILEVEEKDKEILA